MINQKGLFGLVSGITTTSVLQPFQNVKMALMIPPKDLKLSPSFLVNLLLAAKYIHNADGCKGFYKGFVAANIKSGLGSYIYFTILRFSNQSNQSPYEDFVVSSTARIISTFLTNPFNIVETRYQLADFHQYTSVKGALIDIYKKQGVMSFFSGGMASCFKEGLFGGFYYMLYQYLKNCNIPKMTAGITSGMIATVITHPIEIIRARIQTEGLVQKHTAGEHLIIKEIKKIFKQGGYFKGVAPRLMKKPLANTITFYMFQMFQEGHKNYIINYDSQIIH